MWLLTRGGEGWGGRRRFPASAGVTVEGQPLSVINKADCFTGAAGARKRECAMSVSEADNVWNVAAGKPLGAGEGLTFVLSFPKDIVAVVEPEAVEKGLGIWGVLGILALVLIGYIILPAWLFLHWWRVGRDPKIDP